MDVLYACNCCRLSAFSLRIFAMRHPCVSGRRRRQGERKGGKRERGTSRCILIVQYDIVDPVYIHEVVPANLSLPSSSSDYLLSNNHINSIIVLKLDFSDEEVLAYYISFLKTLSFKLNKHTIHFFFNEVGGASSLMYVSIPAVTFTDDPPPYNGPCMTPSSHSI